MRQFLAGAVMVAAAATQPFAAEAAGATPEAVVAHYREIAHADYDDALTGAKASTRQ